MKTVRHILSLAAIAAVAVAVSAPSFAGDGGPNTTPGYMPSDTHPCDPGVAKALSGTYEMWTRTAPFGMTINVDANCNIWGAYARVPGWTTGGNITGKMVGDILIVSLRQSNGLGGAGAMTVGYDYKAGLYTLGGPVQQDGNPYPLNNWSGTKKAALTTGNPTALNDVDVYSGPGGKYRISGMMRKGAAAPKLGYSADGWCKLQGVANGADGWVAVDHLNGC